MTMFRIWLVAGALAMLGLGALWTLPEHRLVLDRPFPVTPVVFIGSSLLENGLPPEAHEGALGDGRAHLRLAARGISEARLLGLAEGVAAQGDVQTLVLEIQPFVRSFTTKDTVARGPWSPLGWVQLALIECRMLGDRLRNLVLDLVGATDNLGRYMREPALLDGPQQLDFEDEHIGYPLILREPEHPEALAAFLERAKGQAIDVYFIAPPQSQAAAEVQGRAAVVALQAHIRDIADRFDTPLLLEPEVWPNAFFIDHGHLNRRGRERLATVLSERWSVRHGG
jgi:hypothetical protein